MANENEDRGMTGRDIALLILLLFGVPLSALLISGLVLKMRVNYQIRHYREATCVVRSYKLEERTNRWAKGTARNELYEIADVSYVAEDRLVVYGRITTQLFDKSHRGIVNGTCFYHENQPTKIRWELFKSEAAKYHLILGFFGLFLIGAGCAIFLIANACCPRRESARSTSDPSDEPFIAPTDQALADLRTVPPSTIDAK